MKHDTLHALLKQLHGLPQKLVLLHNKERYHDNIPEFVLHEFCHERCFDLNTAAYFVDNPDFNCLQGIAGVCKSERDYCKGIGDIWQEPDKYSQYMQQSPFNQKVRKTSSASICHKESKTETIEHVATDLKVTKPDYLFWPLKHGNFGLLIFEHDGHTQDLIDECLEDGVYMLGLCPIS